MTPERPQHVNPGPDTTINPIFTPDTYREKPGSHEPPRCENFNTCSYYGSPACGFCPCNPSKHDARIPASIEPMYLISESKLNQIKNDCLYPERPNCEGCECADRMDDTRASGLGCKFKGANALMDEVIARGPVAQQAPELMICPCAEICSDKCGHHIPHEKNTNCDYSSGCDCQKCHTVQEHRDSAFIAQEREKWERERISATAIEDITPEGAAIVQQAKKQAREDVLKELEQMYSGIPERFLEGTFRYHSEWKAKIESLRPEVKK